MRNRRTSYTFGPGTVLVIWLLMLVLNAAVFVGALYAIKLVFGL